LLARLEVSVTLPPVQKVVDPDAEIEGATFCWVSVIGTATQLLFSSLSRKLFSGSVIETM
jgi:hypothetical protein